MTFFDSLFRRTISTKDGVKRCLAPARAFRSFNWLNFHPIQHVLKSGMKRISPFLRHVPSHWLWHLDKLTFKIKNGLCRRFRPTIISASPLIARIELHYRLMRVIGYLILQKCPGWWQDNVSSSSICRGNILLKNLHISRFQTPRYPRVKSWYHSPSSDNSFRGSQHNAAQGGCSRDFILNDRNRENPTMVREVVGS